ncbi:peptidyl-prolyl cis-trans isomerase [Pseudoxanthomonas helianthi]|uniref:Periplasmic chaperone PpiD n=1 Tax=Pseudoxanthomonas helianthi TaxID=1453541 RepID=A0A940X4H8_9GAMM|nr:peptidyl-prolyl cis-trans isomerase [Pseudoxanthomonas helianthi]MBP3985704.1 peptidyl-prolyl cis-trans isomerase [Pseudoxanthomonas helianthi]
MLQKLRDKTSGWIATLILGLLIIPFAFFGVEQYFTGGSDNYAAKIQAPPTWWSSAPSWWPVSLLWQHDEIGVDQFRERFDLVRRQQSQAQGERFDARAFESVDNKRKVLEQMIDERVLQLAAGRAGVVVSDAAVRAEIEKIPGFQDANGKFDKNAYLMALQTMNPPRTPKQFDQLVRESLLQSVVLAGVGESAFATAGETERVLKLSGETRDVVIAGLPQPAPDTAPVDEAQIKQWYDSHARDFRQPEQVSIEYVDVDGSQLPVAAPDEAALRKRYDEEKARFVSPEQRLVSHILIAVPANADPARQKAAEDKAKALAAQARAPGADFAALAKANSDDTGSKASGGDLGWIERNGAMVKPFEDAVFALQGGTVSEPVKSEFGWHVIQLREIKPGQGKPFEEVRADLERELTASARERAFNDLAGRLVDQINQNPTTLAPAAKAVGLPVQTLGPFSRGNASGIAAVPAVLREAFSEQRVQDGTASDPIEVAPSHSVVIRVAKHVPEQALPLAQAREAVIAAIRADRMQKAAAKAADALLAEVKAGGDLLALGKAKGYLVQEVPGVPRGAPVPTPQANEAMFAAPQPAAGKVSPGKVDLGQGRFLVFAVKKVNPRDMAQVTPAERQQVGLQLGQLDGVSAAEAYTKAMRQRFTIKVAEDKL